MSKEEKHKKTVEEKYLKKTQIQHIKDAPDTYIGSIEPSTDFMHVFNSQTGKIDYRKITYVPGLYKIFDEILVNARDHKIREKTCDKIKVTINQETGQISVWNNGPGIEVEIHKKYGMYVPEFIFSKLLTGSNYDKTIKKTWGGKNGYGAKLANIFSTEFIVDTNDGKHSYHQRFYDHMSKKDEPVIKKSDSDETFTKITFTPDYQKFFKMKTLTQDMVDLLSKRVYDIAGTTRHVKVYLNDNRIKVHSFQEYIDLFYPDLKSQKIYENPHKRWEVCVIYDPTKGYNPISYVNGVATFKGGTHVNHLVNQIVASIEEEIKKKHKDITIRPSQIKDTMTIFINSVIDDPTFTSQTKEEMTTPVKKFGSKCSLSKNFISQIMKTGIMEEVLQLAQIKADAALKKTDGKKNGKLLDIEKLEDALDAGKGKRSKDCTLILTEGDSAKAFAVAGLSVVGRKKFGVFPLRGKMLNVRDASSEQSLTNKEISYLKRIIGLQQGKVYKDVGRLRYGHVLILTDQDVDGSHIKGLVMNFVQYYWPSLFRIKGFIQSMATPIIKAFKGNIEKAKKDPEHKVKTFYTLTDYEKWNATRPNGWLTEYYKGLGTSTNKEAQECFTDYEKKLITYLYEGNQQALEREIEDEPKEEKEDKIDSEGELIEEDEVSEEKPEFEKDLISRDVKITHLKLGPSDDAIAKMFSEARVDDRKTMLSVYDPNNIIDYSNHEITYSDFVNKDLIHFSNYSNWRSIPSIIDGLKPSQRKIIYTAIKNNLYQHHIKVSSFSGVVTDQMDYHHGETSLHETIIGLAQDFVGSNNINIFIPDGQFGSRAEGGKDYASPRYIFTLLNKLMSKVFIKDDLQIVKYTENDGHQYEPEFFVPVVPPVLINGSEGIGTGYSTKIPPYNPKDIVKNILHALNYEPMEKMYPWYQGFKGKIIKIGKYKFKSCGTYEIIGDDRIRITELPVGVWTCNYKKKVLMPLTTDYYENAVKEKLKARRKSKLMKKAMENPKLKKRLLKGEVKIKGMRLKKPIIADFHEGSNHGIYNIDFEVTFIPGVLKELIKDNSIEKTLKLTKPINTSNMYAYDANKKLRKYKNPEDILADYIGVRLDHYIKRKKYLIKTMLNNLSLLEYRVKFIRLVIAKKIKFIKRKMDEVEKKLKEYEFPLLASKTDGTKSYKYLTDMSWTQFTTEKVKELENEYQVEKNALEKIKKTTVIEMWKRELKEFTEEYEQWLAEQENEKKNVIPKEKRKTIKKSKS